MTTDTVNALFITIKESQGIDEHALHKKRHFATTIRDLLNNKVFDVILSKSAKTWKPTSRNFRAGRRSRSSDLTPAPVTGISSEDGFPTPEIVADRFHVARIFLHHFIVLSRDIMGDYASKNKVCALLRTNPKTLKARGRLRLEVLFIEFPALRPIYDEIRQLHALISKKSQTKGQCRHLTRHLGRWPKGSPLPAWSVPKQRACMCSCRARLEIESAVQIVLVAELLQALDARGRPHVEFRRQLRKPGYARAIQRPQLAAAS